MAIVGIEALDILDDRWITTVCSEGLKLGFLLDIFFNDCKIVESLVKLLILVFRKGVIWISYAG